MIKMTNQNITQRGTQATEKYAMLILKSGKRHLSVGMELPNQEKIRKLGEKET